MAIGTRVASVTLPAAQIALVRFLVGIVAVIGAAAAGRASLRPARWGWLLSRGIFGGMAVYLYFQCIAHVGVGVATLLNYIAPVWSLLLGWWLLRERPQPLAMAALAVTVGGVVLVVLGGDGRLRVDGSLWLMAGVLSGIFSGVAVTSIRAVRRRGPAGEPGEGSWTVFASFTTLGALAALPGVLPPLGGWVAPNGAEWAILLAVGIVSVVAQLLMTGALEHVTATTSGVIHELTVVISLAAGIAFFGERLSPTSLVGSVVTMAGVVWAVRISSRARVPIPPAGT